MNDTKFITQKVESQLSYSVYVKVQKESIVQRKEAGSRRNPENTVRLEKDKIVEAEVCLTMYICWQKNR